MANTALLSNFQMLSRNGIGTPILVIVMIAMMVLPLPPFILDVLFTFNIAFALIVLLAGVYTQRPLDFAIFPTVLLLATLLRLTLNVASTRIVLLEGHTGTGAAGQVIKSFGEVVIGGNYTVGLVVFAILVVINFVVVTKGAGRVSEVSARFTLDSLPGKQMAIDADLNAGLISQEQALARREEIAQEADFYGAMDGASKFVRGDAVAGILILLINIVGGLVIGTAQHGMSFADAGHNYVLLTIGDGLVAQIPSLVLSTAAAIMVTRVSKSQDMGSAMLSQVFGNPKSLIIAAIVIGSLGIIPGMPHIAFLGLAAIVGALAYYINKRNQETLLQEQQAAQEAVAEQPKPENKELGWEDVPTVDIIGLEVGYRLIPMVDQNQNGQLLGRIKGIRKKLSQELGFLIPTVHIRDNLDLSPNAYRVTLTGVTAGQAEIFPEKLLAINPGQVFGELKGIACKDPAFGLDAVWIERELREQAQTMGYTVVDASTVIATHISHIIQEHASELIGHEEVQQLLDRLAKTAPKLVSELVPDLLPLGAVVKVLQGLLEEGIPIRDIRTIAETLAEHATKTKDPDALINAVRVSLGRLIVHNINGMNEELPVITLRPELEQLLQNTVKAMNDGGGGFEPGMAQQLQSSLTEIARQQELSGRPAVLVVPPAIRQLLANFCRNLKNSFHVLSYHEIPDNKQIKIVGTVG